MAHQLTHTPTQREGGSDNAALQIASRDAHGGKDEMSTIRKTMWSITSVELKQ